ncbi:restriction endonuclease subunit S [Lactococcus cremoris]
MAKIDDSVKKKVPELRFKGFTDDWEERKLKELFQPSKNKNNNGLYNQKDILAASLGTELIPKRTFFGLKSTKESVKNYRIVKTGDLIYTKSPIKGFPNGIIRSNKGNVGIVPPLYCVYTLQKDINSSIIQFYFEDKNRLDFYLFPLVNVGARNNVNITDLEFLEGKVTIPKSYEEQSKIVQFMEQLNRTIALHQRKLDLLKEQKKGYLQKMFPKNGAKVPELRFAGFADDWEERKFKDILKTHSFRSYLAGVSENGEYEVIQQGDKPIVGYSDGEPFTDYKDITLFGDHTVSLYKPKSPFFVATDGVKILSADNFDGDYLYTTLERYKPEPQGYKRHFTILKNQDVWFTENMEEQQKIGSFFKQLDDTIALHQRKLDLLKEQKKGFLQKMFV